jgi:hypothetical protein
VPPARAATCCVIEEPHLSKFILFGEWLSRPAIGEFVVQYRGFAYAAALVSTPRRRLYFVRSRDGIVAPLGSIDSRSP